MPIRGVQQGGDRKLLADWTLSCCSAEKAMIQAEASQAADLRDARKAFMVAQQLPAPVQERAPHWLASTQFALDKVQEGLASASKADVARVGKIAVAANVAMRLSEVGALSLFSQHLIFVCMHTLYTMEYFPPSAGHPASGLTTLQTATARCDLCTADLGAAASLTIAGSATTKLHAMPRQLAIGHMGWSGALFRLSRSKRQKLWGVEA